MPYQYYSAMSDDDVESVVVFLRTLPAVKNPVPATQIAFPVKYLMRNAPQPITSPVNAPDRGNPVEWGRYVVTIAACAECHTPVIGHEKAPDMAFAGGFHLQGRWGDVASANLTPDPSGISYYDEALFMQVLRTGKVRARQLNEIMPYAVYKNLTADDLKSIFAYLRTVKPVKHFVDNSEPPTYCKRCQGKHGGGDRN
jgi:mono/diheme cytochrome c family protein